MIEHLQTRRQILFDLTANYLDPLDSFLTRLAYIAGLRVPSSGRYRHDRLGTVYGEDAVHEVLARCHEEMFERLLETPLSSQEEALRRYVSSFPGSFPENVESSAKLAETWVPPNCPPYLTELYLSNLTALRALLLDNRTTARSDR